MLKHQCVSIITANLTKQYIISEFTVKIANQDKYFTLKVCYVQDLTKYCG